MDLTAQIIARIQSERLPSAIYHYTSADGFLGIVTSQVIRATDIRYLNDSQEFVYTVRLVSELVDKTRRGASKADERALDECQRALGAIHSARIYVASFSADGDLLSQWRAYCPPTGGFSLGFPPLAVANVTGGSLLPCVYDRDLQVRLLTFVLSAWMKAKPTMQPGPLSWQEANRIAGRHRRSLELAFLLLASIFKHPGFSEEQEWRLVINSRMRGKDSTEEMRTGRSGLVPFVKLPLVRPQYPMWLRQVVVGPNAHQALAEGAAKTLLGNARVTYDSLKRSRIPFRSW